MPPLQRVIVPIPVGGGVDTRSDPLTLQPPKMAEATNVRLGLPGRVEKRRGMERAAEDYQNPTASTSNAVSPARSRWLMARGDELAIGGHHVVKTAPNLEPYWFPSNAEGDAPLMGSLAVTARTLPSFEGRDITLPELAVSDGWSALVYSDEALTRCVVRVFDDASNSQVYSALLEAGATRPRVVAVSERHFMVFYALTASTALKVLLINPGVVLEIGTAASPITVAADLLAATPVFDVALSEGRVLVVYNSTTATTIKHTYVEPSGALESAFTSQATASAVTAVGCAVNEDDSGAVPHGFCLVWASDAGTRLDARLFNKDKSAVAASVQLDATRTGYRQIGACFYTVNTARRCFILYEIAGASRHLDAIYKAEVSSAGASASAGAAYLLHCGLASRPWLDDSDGLNGERSAAEDVHWVAVHDSTLQGSYFVMHGAKSGVNSWPSVKAQLLPGLAGGRLGTVSHLPQVQDVDGVRRWVGLRRDRVFLDGTDLSDAGLPLPSTAVTASGRFPVEFELDAVSKPCIAAIDDVAYVTGGILQRYDGQYAMEAGFLLYPENITSASSAAGGGLVAGAVHIYLVYFQCRTRDGTQRSTTVPVTVTVGPGNNTVTLTIPTLAHTRKRFFSVEGGMSVAVYRNANAGNVWYRVSSPDPTTAGATNGYLANDHGTDTLTFVDQISDATLTGGTKEPDVFASGDVLDHEAPPSCRCIAAGSNRIFVAGCDDPNLIWASKLRNFGEPVEFSDDLTISVDDDAGQPITALAVRGEVLYAFRKNRIYQVSIEPGPDNTGLNGEFSQPRLISWDTGTENPHSVVQLPAGILYQSDRGFYLLGDQGVTYVGADVEAYKDDPVVAATLIPDQHEVRLLQADRTLVYEYLTGAWSVWSVGGLDAVIWQGKWTVLPGDSGLVLQESDTEYKDNGLPYNQVLEWPWLHVGDHQGEQVIKRLLILGTYKGPHKPVVEFAYNYEPAWVDSQEWEPTPVVTGNEYGAITPYGATGSVYGGAAAGGIATTVYQFEVRPSKQRSQAIKIRIRDRTEVGAVPLGDSFSLSAMALEMVTREPLASMPTEKKAT